MTNVANPDVETARMKYAFWLAIIGLLLAAILAVFLVGEADMQNVQSTDIVAIVGLFTSVLGTLVGAFFGLQIVQPARTRNARVARTLKRIDGRPRP